ncbi:MAG: DNA polymerase III subunit beta [bacterium]
MKLTILQEKLKEGMAVIDKVSPRNFTLPILKNILLKTEKSFLKISATDLETGITWWGLAKIEEEGDVTVPGSLFSGLLSLISNRQISLSTKDQVLLAESEGYKTKIKTSNPEDFPIIPSVPDNEYAVIDTQSFCRGLSQVVDVAATSNARPEIGGIFFSFTKDSLRMAATDSFRLAEKIINIKQLALEEKEYSFIVPKKTAKEVISVFADKGGEMRIYFSPNQIMFELAMEETSHPLIRLTSRLVEGEYPNYREIIPQDYGTQVILSRDNFLSNIKGASLFGGKVNEVKIETNPKDETIEISSQNPEAGEFNSSIRGELKGKRAEVYFDCRFLIEGLTNIKSSEILLGVSGGEDGGPGVIKPVGDDSYVYVVMPIRNN